MLLFLKLFLAFCDVSEIVQKSKWNKILYRGSSLDFFKNGGEEIDFVIIYLLFGGDGW